MQMEAEMYPAPTHPLGTVSSPVWAWHLFRESHYIDVFYRNQTLAGANRVSTEVAMNFTLYLLSLVEALHKFF